MSLYRAVLPFAALALGAVPLSAQRVSFERPGYRLSSIGERVIAVARVLDNSGRPVRNAPITFRIADPSVATVSSRGEMVARKVGNTFVWAIAGRDSASAIVLVEQLAAKFSFSPPTLRLDALGAKVPLKIQASDAAGNPLPGGTTKASFCRSMNERVASLARATGEVTAVANGATYIRCADRGIADSLRIEVQQRPSNINIVSGKNARHAVGDTFTVKVTGKDRLGKEVVDVRPTWVSLNPTVVSVDAQTGKAQSRDAGDARIIVQIGDVADTANVNVFGSRAPIFQAAAPVADVPKDTTLGATSAAIVAAPRTALFKFSPVELTVGQLLPFNITARDSTGTPMSLARLTFDRGYDTSVAIIRRDSVLGKKEGNTTVVARLGTYIDTVNIHVHLPAATALFHEPVRHLDSASINARRRDEVLAVIRFDSSATRHQLSRVVVSGNGLAMMAGHSIHPSSDVVESRTGFLSGGEATVTLFRYLDLGGTFGTGNLTPVALGKQTTVVGENLQVLEGEGDLTFVPVSWLGVRAGYGKRTEKTPLATQSWTIPRFSVINRFDFTGDKVNTMTALSILPGAKYSGTASDEQPSAFSLSGEAGLELQSGFFRVGVSYYVERFNFTNSTRVDQFSALRFRLGLSSGRR